MMDEDYPSYVRELEHMLISLFRGMKEQHVQDAAELKLSMPQFVCLWVISRMGKFKMSDLATYLALSYASATNLINRLVDSGLVTRYDDPDDRRVVIVELSNKGKEITSLIREKHLKKLMENCEKISHEERDTMLKGLLTLTNVVKKDESLVDKKCRLMEEFLE
jgi:DNA-binding MarR family transcriptional regulator